LAAETASKAAQAPSTRTTDDTTTMVPTILPRSLKVPRILASQPMTSPRNESAGP